MARQRRSRNPSVQCSPLNEDSARAHKLPRMTIPHPSGEQFELTHGDQHAVVVEVGGGLRRYAVGAWEVLDGYGAAERIGAGRGQVLIPWLPRAAAPR
jgi:hypothetical protein